MSEFKIEAWIETSQAKRMATASLAWRELRKLKKRKLTDIGFLPIKRDGFYKGIGKDRYFQDILDRLTLSIINQLRCKCKIMQ